MRLSSLPSILACLLLPAVVRAEDASALQGPEFFTKKIEPILRESCYKCHSHSSDKIKGGLVLDSRDAALTGGDTGAAVVPGDPAKSLLIEAISYKNEDLEMPPKGKKLSDEQIASLTEWVKMGAPWPEEPGQKMKTRAKGRISDEDRAWWAFQAMAKVEPPAVEGVAHPIDRFIFQRLKAEGLQPAPPASPEKLVRRLYFDLVGLPPTPEEVAAFMRECRDGKDSRDGKDRTANDIPSVSSVPPVLSALADRLLSSPRYGERWARHWLDLVRYAESDGYRADEYRPDAWRYRDYVIRSLNADKPYDRFVQEQLAGDELWPGDPDAQVATGFLTHGIYEYNNRNVAGQWTNMLNDLTDTTADVFLGMGVQCARCHDHKFDPILQKDYFRLQAFFAPIRYYDESVVATREQREAHAQKLAAWEEKTAELRRQIADIEAKYKVAAEKDAVEKFPPETRAIIAKPQAERTPYEQQIVELAWRQVEYEWSDKRFPARVKEPAKAQRTALLTELQKFAADRPDPLPVAPSATDIGPLAPPVTIPKKAAMGEIEPGFLSVLDEAPAKIEPVNPKTTGRRAALARWLTQPENPLAARVIVNRVWQYHFGRGLAVNASDFGKLGEKPSHPELLDWLSRWFVENGWSFKKLHRLIVTSATYQQSVTNPIAETARLKDPENVLLWRGATKRLDAEQIRDAVLSMTGEIQFPPDGGPGHDASRAVRTIYNKVIRNTRDPMLDVFDVPEGFASTSLRNVTTTPTQSLLMINSRWSLERAAAFAERLRKQSSSDEDKLVADAFRLAFNREPSKAERDGARGFLDRQSGVVTTAAPVEEAAPFASEKMQFRDGRAALLTPDSPQERLIVASDPAFPKGDFTIEACLTLRSIYETGSVRTIVSQWDGKRGHPGWSLGITGKGSRHKPQTLVLQLCGDTPWRPTDPIEPIFSGLHIEIGRPYFVAVAVDLEDATEKGITFYVKDLSNDDEQMQTVRVTHSITSGIANDAPLTIGGPPTGSGNLFDGLIDDVRLSNIPLRAEQLLFTSAATGEHTVGYWKFEPDPGPYADSSGRAPAIAAPKPSGPREDPRQLALVDFCHVLLNSNEFLYVD